MVTTYIHGIHGIGTITCRFKSLYASLSPSVQCIYIRVHHSYYRLVLLTAQQSRLMDLLTYHGFCALKLHRFYYTMSSSQKHYRYCLLAYIIILYSHLGAAHKTTIDTVYLPTIDATFTILTCVHVCVPHKSVTYCLCATIDATFTILTCSTQNPTPAVPHATQLTSFSFSTIPSGE